MSNLFSGITTETIEYLEQALDGAAKRHQVISNNIANVDTPNFKRSDVPFLDELKKAIKKTAFPSLKLATTHNMHISGLEKDPLKLVIVQQNNLTFRNDGNNVDIDKEITEMIKNNILYNSYLQLLISKLSGLKNIIEEGRR